MDSSSVSFFSNTFSTSQLSNISKIWETTTSFWKSRLLYAVTRLDIPFHLKNGKKSTAELAKLANVNEAHLYRVMRSLETIGIFREVEPNIYENSEQSQIIAECNDVKNGILFEAGDVQFKVWETIVDTIQKGRSDAFKILLDSDSNWDYHPKDIQYQTEFKNYMSSLTKNLVPFFTSICDFSRFNVVADLGGNEGIFISAILKNNQNIKVGINFDMETVIQNNIRRKLDPSNNDPRFKNVGGDFFVEVPVADCYTMKFILHDWDDEQSIKILQTIGKSMKPGGKIIIFDQIIDSSDKSDDSYHRAVWFDSLMMQVCNGKERTKDEWINIAILAGYKVETIVAPYFLVLTK